MITALQIEKPSFTKQELNSVCASGGGEENSYPTPEVRLLVPTEQCQTNHEGFTILH